MKYRTQSANVLNEADNFQRILDWQLFCMEQDALLWQGESNEWCPGIPLNKHPWTRGGEIGPVEDAVYWDGEWGNHTRPMIEEIEIKGARMLCCEVWWARNYEESSECWVCGKEFPPLERMIEKQPIKPLVWRSAQVPQEPIAQIMSARVDESGFVVEMQDVMGRMQELNRRLEASFRAQADYIRRAADQMSTYMRGFSAQFVVFDEADAFFAFDPISMRRYVEADVEVTRRAFLNRWVRPYQPSVNPEGIFKKPEFTLELVPRFYAFNMWASRVSPPRSRTFNRAMRDVRRAAIEKRWQRDIPPVPKFPDINLEDFNVHRYPRCTINQPITEQRRRRRL